MLLLQPARVDGGVEVHHEAEQVADLQDTGQFEFKCDEAAMLKTDILALKHVSRILGLRNNPALPS